MPGDRVYIDPQIDDCPCCDNQVQLVESITLGTFYIRCVVCPIKTNLLADRQELIEHWNTRPDSNDIENERRRGDEQFDRAEQLYENMEKAIDVLEYCKEKIDEFFAEDDEDEPEQPIFRSK